MSIEVSSPSFRPDGPIPRRFTGEGQDVSPPLEWRGAPSTARGFAVLCEDPDAPGPEPWVHWLLYDLPPSVRRLAEGSNGGAREGRNSWKGVGWRGPLPPAGHGEHHYHFRVFALDAPLDLPQGASKTEILRALRTHVIDEGEVVGTYERRARKP